MNKLNAIKEAHPKWLRNLLAGSNGQDGKHLTDGGSERKVIDI